MKPLSEPLSEVLALLKPRTYVSPGLHAGGDWAVQFPAHEGIKFNAVTQGACWVAVEGGGVPCRLEQGDCFLLTSGRPFVLARSLSSPKTDAREIYTATCDSIATCNGGGDFFLVGARFEFEGEHVGTLFGNLPPFVPVRDSTEEAPVLRWALDRFAAEIRGGKPGRSLIAEHLAHIMLIQVLRLHLAAKDSLGAGWLFALADPQLSTALTAMHADIARRWTIEDLGRTAGMSRSTFAKKFKQALGASPMEYLTHWRMRVAGDRLRHTSGSIAAIANAIGYESEAAFSTAFKKAMGRPPLHFRRMDLNESRA
jgi:AraC-like DNA-binding protein